MIKRTIKSKNGYRLIIFLLIYVFGFYGWGVTGNFSTISIFKEAIIITTLIITISLLYLHRDSLRFELELKLEKKEFFTTIGLFLAIFFSNLWILDDALTLDEIAYAWLSQLHSYVLLFKIAELKNELLLRLQSAFLLHLVSVFLCAFIFLAVRLMLKIINEKHFLLVAIALLFSLRFMVSYFGGGESQHAPLGYLFYFVFSSVFGSNVWVFRISTLVLFVLASLLVLSFLRNQIKSYFLYFSLTLAIYSTPLIHNMLFIIEVSIWAYLLNTLLLVYLYSRKFEISSSLLLAVAIFTYFRMSLFATLASLWVAYLAQNWRKFQLNHRFIVSIALALPALVLNIFERLRSSDVVSENFLDILRENISNFNFALENSGSRTSVVISLITVVFFIYRYPCSRVFMISFSLINSIFFLLFNSPGLSFNSKYLVEWCMPPLVLASAYLCTIRLKNVTKWNLVLIALVIIIASQSFSKPKVEENFRELYNSKEPTLAYSAIPRIPFSYEKAYGFLRRQEEFCLAIGPVYSTFPEIINGFDLNYAVYLRELRARFLNGQSLFGESSLEVSSKTLDYAGVRCALLGYTENYSPIIHELLDDGWILVKRFKYDVFGTSVYLIKKSPE